jgi:hypothetical protein
MNSGSFQTKVPLATFDIVLARPTGQSIVVGLLAYQDLRGYISYGTNPEQLSKSTGMSAWKTNEQHEVMLVGLKPNARYYFRFCYQSASEGQLRHSTTQSFTTARAPGSAFSFAIQADSHLDGGTDLEVYKRSLNCAARCQPDFFVDLGDTFMTDKYADYRQSAAQYLAQRFYFSTVSAPLFLVLGNHDGERGWQPRDRGGEVSAWSNRMREYYFPNPVPDSFYTGNRQTSAAGGLLQDYYAWTWGDALFVVLDPYWYTTEKRGDSDNWAWTLGERQYFWLKQTLESSRAAFKFIFIHHLVGGTGRGSRGGVEAAPYYEWGGRSLDGQNVFTRMRPGWPEPIHNLLVRTKVSAVFHGHDHFFAKQDLDGIVYQEVPQPGLRQADARSKASEYGYSHGEIIDGSGILKVKVESSKATVSFVRALYSYEKDVDRGGVVQYEYEIPASQRARAGTVKR